MGRADAQILKIVEQFLEDEIIRAHPHLTLAQIHDALSYYYENTEEIHAEIGRDEQMVEELKNRVEFL